MRPPERKCERSFLSLRQSRTAPARSTAVTAAMPRNRSVPSVSTLSKNAGKRSERFRKGYKNRK